MLKPKILSWEELANPPERTLTEFDKKLREYHEILGDYPPSEPDYPFEEDEMIEIMDYCIKNGVKFEDAVGFEYEEGYVY